MDQKIIFLDIDGTLTEPGSNKPPESAVQAIRQARDAGHYIFLCTGRNYNMLIPLLKYGFDGVIASAGGYIECQNKVIYDCPMTENQKRSAMDVLKGNGIYRTVECIDGSYTDEKFKEFLRAHASEGDNGELLRWQEQIEKSLNILPMSEYRGQPVYKIVIMSLSMERIMKSQKILASDFEFCIQNKNKDGFINGEIINKKFNKGKAIKQVCDYLHIPISNSVAIGDSMNDKEMLETAGLSICMENGSEELKKIVDDICPCIQENGIRDSFIKYHFIESKPPPQATGHQT